LRQDSLQKFEQVQDFPKEHAFWLDKQVLLDGVVFKNSSCVRETILQKGKKRNLARDLAIYLCREITDERCVALGRYFGGISGAGIVFKYSQIANQIEVARKFKERVNKIRKKILNI